MMMQQQHEVKILSLAKGLSSLALQLNLNNDYSVIAANDEYVMIGKPTDEYFAKISSQNPNTVRVEYDYKVIPITDETEDAINQSKDFMVAAATKEYVILAKISQETIRKMQSSPRIISPKSWNLKSRN